MGAIGELSRHGDRFKLTLHSKLKALELLGRHLGMFRSPSAEPAGEFQFNAEDIRENMLAKLRQAQEMSEKVSEDSQGCPEAPEAMP